MQFDPSLIAAAFAITTSASEPPNWRRKSI
jgi:hypothetical protein